MPVDAGVTQPDTPVSEVKTAAFPVWPGALVALMSLAVWAIFVIKTHPPLAWDFHLYYAAGRLPPAKLYDFDAQMAAQHEIWENLLNSNWLSAHGLSGTRPFNFSPFLKPAYYRLLLAPLAALSFWRAYAVWTVLQAAALMTALIVLGRRFGYRPVWFFLLPVCPYISICFNWGQDAPVILMLLALSLELLLQSRDGAAGAVLALGLVKWNVLLVLPLVLLVQRRWKAWWSFAAVAAVEVAVSIWITGAGGAPQYIAMLRGDSADFMARGMPSLRGMLLLASLPNGAVTAVNLLALVLALMFIRRLELAEAFSIGVAASVFLAYHTMIYDLLFLLIPIIVLAPQLQKSWKAMGTVLMISPVMGLSTGLARAAGLLWFSLALLTSVTGSRRVSVAAASSPRSDSGAEPKAEAPSRVGSLT